MFAFLLKKIDNTTMYRVVLYTLGVWAMYSLLLSVFDLLYFSSATLLLSLGTIVGIALAVHYALRWASKASAANVESSLITALILFFVLEPGTTVDSLVSLAIVTAIAIASKYALRWRHVHLFNPVAVGIVATELLDVGFATWWIGSPLFMWLVVLGGAIITQKIRRWELVGIVLVVSFVSHVAVVAWFDTLTIYAIASYWYSWPILFYAMVMVTEPLSTPPGLKHQRWYALFIGVLSAIPFSLGVVSNSLAFTLLLANALFFPLQLGGRPRLTLKSITAVADHVYELVFTPSFRFPFTAGQYVEWTLPHATADDRGIRRYFTIASAPESSDITLGVKMYPQPSTFKSALVSLSPGDSLLISSLDGDFTLPANPSANPLVFVAGGIGVTPYRSMVEHLVKKNTAVNATLFYFVRSEAEIAWSELWEAGKSIGLRTVFVVDQPNSDWKGEVGTLTPELITRYVTEPQHTLFYLSGPPGMVRAFAGVLVRNGAQKRNIKKDYFPGLA